MPNKLGGALLLLAIFACTTAVSCAADAVVNDEKFDGELSADWFRSLGTSSGKDGVLKQTGGVPLASLHCPAFVSLMLNSLFDRFCPGDALRVCLKKLPPCVSRISCRRKSQRHPARTGRRCGFPIAVCA
jgi:hypothetical protein